MAPLKPRERSEFGITEDKSSGLGNARRGNVAANGYNLTGVGTVSAAHFVGSLTGNADSASSVPWTGVTARPTKLSDFDNDIGVGGGASTWDEITGKPTKVSYFANDAGYITGLQLTWNNLQGRPQNISAFVNDAGYITNSTSITVQWTNVSGRPTKLSQFENDGLVSISGSYQNPTWLQSLAGSKITGAVANATNATTAATCTGNATTVTNGVYTTGSYYDPSWITGLSKSKLIGLENVENIRLSTWTGSSAITTVGTLTTGQIPWSLIINAPAAGPGGGDLSSQNTYYDPQWLTGISASKVIGAVNVALSANTCTGNAATVTNGVYTSGSYSNPSWLTALAGSKISGAVASANAVPWTGVTGRPTKLSDFENDIITTPNWTDIVDRPTALSAFTNDVGFITSAGNTATVTNGVYTVGDQTIDGIKTFSKAIVGAITGNAGTVTNGVYTTGAYANPAWITSLAGSKITGNIAGKAATAGNADTVTNGVYTTGTYTDPAWLMITKAKVGLGNVENTALSTWTGSANITTIGTATAGSIPWTLLTGAPAIGDVFTSGSYEDPAWLVSIAGSKVVGNIAGKAATAGNADTVTSGLYSTGSYADPAWLTSLAGSKISGAVAEATHAAFADSTLNGVLTTASYTDPAWIVNLDGAKITGTINASIAHAETVTNGVYTNQLYDNPAWITSLAKSKVGLANVENTALSTWTGSSYITTIGTITSGTVPWARISGAPTTYQPSGSAAGDLSGTYPNPTLKDISGLTPGIYGSATKIPVFSVDSKGRITAISESQLGAGGVTVPLALVNPNAPISAGTRMFALQTPHTTTAGTGAIFNFENELGTPQAQIRSYADGSGNTSLILSNSIGGTLYERIKMGGNSTTIIGNVIASGTVTGTNLPYSTSTYSDPTWLTSLSGAKISGYIRPVQVEIDPTSNTLSSTTTPTLLTDGLSRIFFDHATNNLTIKSDGIRLKGPIWLDGTETGTGLVTTSGSYSDPSWLTGLSASKLTTGTLPSTALPTSGATAGTYGDSSHIPQITIDNKGRITNVSSIATAGGGGGVTAPLPLQQTTALTGGNTLLRLVSPYSTEVSNTGQVITFEDYNTSNWMAEIRTTYDQFAGADMVFSTWPGNKSTGGPIAERIRLLGSGGAKITGNLQVTGTINGITVGDISSTGSYADPSWITSLAGSKLTGTISAAAIPWANVTGAPTLLSQFTNDIAVGGDSLPTQTGNAGKYLTTDGTDASWASVSGALTVPLILPASSGSSLGSTVIRLAAPHTAAGYGSVLTFENDTGSVYAKIRSNWVSSTETDLVFYNRYANTLTERIRLSSKVIVTGDLQVTGNITGANIGTGGGDVSTTGSYEDPSWIVSLAKSKVGLGNVENTALSTWAGSANITTLGTIVSGSLPWSLITDKPTIGDLSSSGSYADPAWITSLAGSKIFGSITTATIDWANIQNKPTLGTGDLVSTGSYENPTWLVSLAGSKISGSVALADAASAVTWANVTDKPTIGDVSTSGSYTDPSWLTITKAKVGLGNVENTALSTWAGSANITTVGTLASGSIPYSLLTDTPTIPAGLPDQTGHADQVLVTNGTTADWTPGVPISKKFTVAYNNAAFTAAATGASVTLFNLPARAKVMGVTVMHSSAFAGTGITSAVVSVGSASDFNFYTEDFDVLDAASNTNFQDTSSYISKTFVADDVVFRLTANTNLGNGSTTVLTAGSVDVWVTYTVLP